MAGGCQLRKAGQPIDTGKAPAPAPKVASDSKGKRKAIVAGGQLDRLSEAGYLPSPETAYARPGLTVVNGTIVQEIDRILSGHLSLLPIFDICRRLRWKSDMSPRTC